MSGSIYIYDNVIVFAPLSKEKLEKWLVKHDYNLPRTVFFEGDKDYVAFMDTEGTAYGDEEDLVVILSTACKDEKVFSFWTNDQEYNCSHFLNGELAKEEKSEVIAFAKKLGIVLPDIAPLPEAAHSFCLIKDIKEGIFLNEFEKYLLGTPDLKYSKHQSDVILFSAVEGYDVASSLSILIECFLEKEIYSFSINTDNRFAVIQWTKEGEILSYAMPVWPEMENTLDNIEGETEPQKILDKLSIPKAVMTYK